MYNAACCQVKLKQWAEATESVSLAVNEYQLPMKTAMQVPCLASAESVITLVKLSQQRLYVSISKCGNVDTVEL